VVATTLRSLLEQDYPGSLATVLVDDHSEDGTRQLAQQLALGAMRPLEVVGAPPLPAGWSGKLWAVEQGVRLAGQRWPEATYLLLTDADIAHAPDNLARLVGKAERERLDLVSLMVQLRCASFWERLLVPAFVFLFQMLYPFAAVNQAGRRTAAAAGGCILVRRRALMQAGGIAAIRDRLIDEVALARAIKHRPGGGRIWLGLGDSARRLRRYDRIGPFWAMVARTADTQLDHSRPLLAATVVAMILAFAARRSRFWPGRSTATSSRSGRAGSPGSR
jgi:hopene-associated glycosyltransferase HpnB